MQIPQHDQDISIMFMSSNNCMTLNIKKLMLYTMSICSSLKNLWSKKTIYLYSIPQVKQGQEKQVTIPFGKDTKRYIEDWFLTILTSFGANEKLPYPEL